jgi:TonB family protein
MNRLPATFVAVLFLAMSAAAQQPTPPRVRIGADVPAPPRTKTVAPVYPDEARTAGVTGTVRLELLIGTDGKVRDARVIDSVPLLDAAAIDAARQWEFRPVLLNGAPVEALLTTIVGFPPVGEFRGTQEAVLEFDRKGVDFDPWLRRFVSTVRRNWFVPQSANDLHGSVGITFVVHRNGTITDVVVSKPSDAESLNRSARNAIEGATSVEPLPAQFPDESAKFTVTFSFNDTPGRAAQANPSAQ